MGSDHLGHCKLVRCYRFPTKTMFVEVLSYPSDVHTVCLLASIRLILSSKQGERERERVHCGFVATKVFCDRNLSHLFFHERWFYFLATCIIISLPPCHGIIISSAAAESFR